MMKQLFRPKRRSRNLIERIRRQRLLFCVFLNYLLFIFRWMENEFNENLINKLFVIIIEWMMIIIIIVFVVHTKRSSIQHSTPNSQHSDNTITIMSYVRRIIQNIKYNFDTVCWGWRENTLSSNNSNNNTLKIVSEQRAHENRHAVLSLGLLLFILKIKI